MSGRSAVDDPLKVTRFRIEIDGFTRAGFSECSGLSDESEVTEYREGGDEMTVRKSPGLTKYDDITLKRGIMAESTQGGDFDLWDWREQVRKIGTNEVPMEFRKTIDIVQYNRSNKEVRRWRVREVWPSKLVAVPNLDAKSSDDAIEEMVLVQEGYDKADEG